MDIEYLHLYVENAADWQKWFVNILQFQPIFSKFTAQLSDYAVQSGRIRVLLSSRCGCNPEVGHFLECHPEGVADVAFRVKDMATVLMQVQAAGNQPPPVLHESVSDIGILRWCRIQGWGSLRHTLIEYPEVLDDSFEQQRDCSKVEPPAAQPPSPESWTGAAAGALPWCDIDHAVLNVPAGSLESAATWYETHLGFTRQQQFDIATDQSGLRSLVLKHPDGTATLPINEPMSLNSQIQEFLDLHGGAGIQHVALRTHNLVKTVAKLRQQGVAFLAVPQEYYDQLQQRPGFWPGSGDWDAIAQQQILVDWPIGQPQLRLLQTFTQPLFKQPTFFWELIERQSLIVGDRLQQAEGFGAGNFQALFEAIERQQQARGSL